MTLGDLKKFIKVQEKELSESGFNKQDIESIPVYIGDDEELNGIHYCDFVQTATLGSDSWYYYDDQVDYAIKDKYIIIS